MTRNGDRPGDRSAPGKQKKAGHRGIRHRPEVEMQVKTALALNYPAAQVARETGVPRSTVREIAKRLTPEEREQCVSRCLAASYEIIAEGQDRLLSDIRNPEKRLSGMELNAIVGTHIDKTLLLTGHPTQLHLHQVEILREEMQSREQLIRRLHGLGILHEVLDVTPKETPHAPEN